MKTTIASAVLLAALLAGAPAVRAADNDALAADVARMVMPEETYGQILAAVEAQTREAIPRILEKVRPGMDAGEAAPMLKALAPALSEEEAKLFRRLMPSYEEMVGLQGRLLAKHYAADELRELHAFYRSPVGRKTIRIMPEVAREAMGWMQDRMMERMPAAMADFEAVLEVKVREYEKAHRK